MIEMCSLETGVIARCELDIALCGRRLQSDRVRWEVVMLGAAS